MVNKLEDKEFAWHEGQSPAPGWSAQEAQKFFDAPSKKLMEKLNELIEAATNLEQELGALGNNRVEDIEVWLSDEDVAKKYPSITAVVDYIERLPLEQANHRVSYIDPNESGQNGDLLYPSVTAVIRYIASLDLEEKQNKISNFSHYYDTENTDLYPTACAVANYVNELLNELLTDVGGNIESVRKTANENAQAITDHEGKIEELRQAANDLLSANETATLAIQDNADAISENKGLIDGHTEQLQALAGDIGEIDTALDNIITLQQSFIGGDAA